MHVCIDCIVHLLCVLQLAYTTSTILLLYDQNGLLLRKWPPPLKFPCWSKAVNGCDRQRWIGSGAWSGRSQSRNGIIKNKFERGQAFLALTIRSRSAHMLCLTHRWLQLVFASMHFVRVSAEVQANADVFKCTLLLWENSEQRITNERATVNQVVCIK